MAVRQYYDMLYLTYRWQQFTLFVFPTDGSSSKSALCVTDELKFLLEDGGLAAADSNHTLELPPWFDWDKFRR
jgi:hypothetical protein